MKKILLPLTMLIGLSLSAQDRILDFRDILFGARLDSIYISGSKVEFQKDRNASLRNAYEIPGDNQFIGNVKLNKINYIFNDDSRFFKVFMQGNKEDVTQMRFILNFKFGEHRNESVVDGIRYQQWVIKDVTFTLAEFDRVKFELVMESNWQASETYKKNTNVDDF